MKINEAYEVSRNRIIILLFAVPGQGIILI